MTKRTALIGILFTLGFIGRTEAATEGNGAAAAAEQIRIINQELETAPNPSTVDALLRQRSVLLAQVIALDPSQVLRLELAPEAKAALAQVAGQTQSLIETRGEWEGRLEEIVEDDFSRGEGRTHHYLKGTNEVLEMRFSGSIPSSDAQRTIRVKGVRLGQDVAVGEWQFEDGSLMASSSPCSTTGEQKIAIILVSFPGKPLLSTITTDMLRKTYFGTSLSLDSFLRESSYGKAWATGDVFGPVVLDADYFFQPTVVRDAAIRAAAGLVDFRNYNRIVLVVPQSSTGLESGGLGTIGCEQVALYPQGSIMASTTWLGDVSMGSESAALAAANHEMGHNLGLEHARAADFGAEPLGPIGQLPVPWDGTREYGDSFSNMARDSWHWAAPHKVYLGWLKTGTDVLTVETTGSFVLQPYEDVTSTVKAIRVRRGTGNDAWLWLENRQPRGLYDLNTTNSGANKLAGFTGAMIHYEDAAWNDTSAHTNLLRFDTDIESGLFFGRAPLAAGRSWSDPYSNLTINVSQAAGGLQIGVSFASSSVCPGGLSPGKLTFSSDGGTGSIDVVAPTTCAWTAISSIPWIAISSGSTGTGNGKVTFAVSASAITADRWARINVGSSVVVVTQHGLAGSATIAPTSAVFPSAGGNGELSVFTNAPDFAWSYSSNASWIQSIYASDIPTVGTKTLRYVVAQNTNSASRTGTVTVAGQTFTVTQNAGAATVSQFVWQDVSALDAPISRIGMDMAPFTARGEVVLYGGGADGTVFGDTWVWNGTSWTQKNPAHNPGKRNGHAMAYDAEHKQLVLFGGFDAASNYSGDTWIWDGVDWTQLHPKNNPPARAFHAMAYNAATKKIVLFGGFPTLSDTWEWDGSNWTERFSTDVPHYREGHAMAFDAARGEIVLFGGAVNVYSLSPTFFGDTWVWNGNQWKQKLPATSPSPRWDQRMDYDPELGQIILVGGSGLTGSRTADIHEETWTWDGTNWQQRFPDKSPEFSYTYGMVYDSVHKAFVVHLGDDLHCATRGPKTYVLQAGLGAILLSPYSSVVPVTGQVGSVSVAANISWNASSPDSWITVTAGVSGNGNGTVSYAISANPSTRLRNGTILVGGQVFTIIQAGSVPSDFNGDGKTDLLWYNAVNGQTSTWSMNGTSVSSYRMLLADPSWTVTTTADFDGDGKADLLWYNKTTRQTTVWLMNGVNISSWATLLTDPDWKVIGTADFNGDGKSDLLWYNAVTGQTAAWLMNGLAQSSAAVLLTDLNWKVTATADLNGDGKADLLWYNLATGQTSAWLMNGLTQSSAAVLLTDVNWKVTLTADFNGDGKSDLIWYNAATGQTAAWLMNGTNISSSASLLTDPNWKVTATPDLDGDGKSDVLWYNAATGQTATWLMNGTSISSSATLLADPDWKTVAVGK